MIRFNVLSVKNGEIFHVCRSGKNITQLVRSKAYRDSFARQFCRRSSLRCSEFVRSPYRSADGRCNNLLYPTLGSRGATQSRYLPPKYEDGNYTSNYKESFAFRSIYMFFNVINCTSFTCLFSFIYLFIYYFFLIFIEFKVYEVQIIHTGIHCNVLEWEVFPKQQ